MIGRLIIVAGLALALIGCTIEIQPPTVAEYVPSEEVLPSPTTISQADLEATTVALRDAEVASLATTVANSGLEATTVAIEATMQAEDKQAALGAAQATHQANVATATTMAHQPTATAYAIATEEQAAFIARETAEASRVAATQAAFASTSVAATADAQVAMAQATQAVVSSLATSEAQQRVQAIEAAELQKRQAQAALERSQLINEILQAALITAPILLGIFIILTFYRERRRLQPQPQLVPLTSAGPVIGGDALATPNNVNAAPKRPVPNNLNNLFADRLAPPDWASLNQWRGLGLPLGIYDAGLLINSLDAHANLLFVGSSGNHLTRFGLRPIIAASLKKGWHVTIFDKTGWNYMPFSSHPNAAAISLGSAQDAFGYLQAIYAEIEKRQGGERKVTRHGWEQDSSQQPPQCLVVFDEFTQLLNSLNENQQNELWRGLCAVAALGRQVGIHLAVALQDPDSDIFNPLVNDHFLRISYRLRDEAASRLMIGCAGAETLSPRHFLVRLHGLIHGVAFDPTDSELRIFLSQNSVPQVEPPGWARAISSAIFAADKPPATVMGFGPLPVQEKAIGD